jgi:hypothetical protein
MLRSRLSMLVLASSLVFFGASCEENTWHQNLNVMLSNTSKEAQYMWIGHDTPNASMIVQPGGSRMVTTDITVAGPKEEGKGPTHLDDFLKVSTKKGDDSGSENSEMLSLREEMKENMPYRVTWDGKSLGQGWLQ